MTGVTWMPSYGLLVQGPQLRIFLTGDVKFSPTALMPYYQQADIIFHDCETRN